MPNDISIAAPQLIKVQRASRVPTNGFAIIAVFWDIGFCFLILQKQRSRAGGGINSHLPEAVWRSRHAINTARLFRLSNSC